MADPGVCALAPGSANITKQAQVGICFCYALQSGIAKHATMAKQLAFYAVSVTCSEL